MIPEIRHLISIIKESDAKEDCLAILEELYKYGREAGINIHDLLHQIGSGIDELKN